MAEEKSRLEQFKELVELDPSDAYSRYALAMEYMSVGNFDESLRQLQEVIRLEPDNHTACFQAGVACRKTGNVEGAKRFWKRGIEAAQRKGDSHAVDKMIEALEILESGA
jgi:tetratricopeptide (TPR) repeat protein